MHALIFIEFFRYKYVIPTFLKLYIGGKVCDTEGIQRKVPRGTNYTYFSILKQILSFKTQPDQRLALISQKVLHGTTVKRIFIY